MNKKLFFRFFDLCSILLSLHLSAEYLLPPYLDIFEDYTGASFFTVVVFFLSFYMLDCSSVGREEFRESALRVILAVLIGTVGTGFIFYTFENWRFPRLMFILQMFMAMGLTLGWRALYFQWQKRRPERPVNVLFVGAGNAGRARAVLGEYMPQARILGYMGEPGAPEEDAGPFLGPADETLLAVERKEIFMVVVLDPFYLDEHLVRELFAAKLRGLQVEDMRNLYERLAGRVPVDLIEEDWLLLEDGFNLNVQHWLKRLKRTYDLGIACCLLLFTWPLIVLAAVCVRIESPGNPFYVQRRVGLGGREFSLVKIRSMRQDAEVNGAVWASRNDPRVTRVGRVLRKTRLDELPQLFNVIKGDMSLIGPRPERLDFVRDLERTLPYYDVRHTVKPGITGWAQVCYPYGASLEDARFKLEYDLYYIKHMSLLLDAKIFLKTIGVVLFPKGAR